MTPLPWAVGQRSWMDGIETGLSGLGFYLYYTFKQNLTQIINSIKIIR